MNFQSIFNEFSVNFQPIFSQLLVIFQSFYSHFSMNFQSIFSQLLVIFQWIFGQFLVNFQSFFNEFSVNFQSIFRVILNFNGLSDGSLLFSNAWLTLDSYFNFSDLSALFDAIESLLFPLTWQHTLIPALPPSMTAFLQAPTPYLIGILTDAGTTIHNSMCTSYYGVQSFYVE